MLVDMFLHVKNAKRKKWFMPLALAATVTVVLIGLLIHSMLPGRSVANYCRIYAQEKIRLQGMSNQADPYPSGTFNVSVNDAGQIAQSFGKLDGVAPTEIEPNVKTLQELYQKIHNDPSQAIAASLSGGQIDDTLAAWTKDHCGS